MARDEKASDWQADDFADRADTNRPPHGEAMICPLINPARVLNFRYRRVTLLRAGKLESFIAWAPIAVAVFTLTYFLAQQFLRPVVQGWVS